MIFRKDELRLNFKLIIIASAIILLVTASTPPAVAINNDKELIHIESDTQSLDAQGNVITFTGNVIVTQGTIKIKADKIVLTRPGDKHGEEIIDGYGTPATFYQRQDNGKSVKGHASQMHYELAKNYIVLTGNAYLD